MRKLLSVILVLAMVLGLVGTALAAAPADVAGGKYEGAVVRLQALGILKGYSDGTFKPANNITRAEVAAMMVRSLGLEETAKSTVGQTKFTDVSGTHWAAGYINVAVGQGVIDGYPDGTFKPEANITNAEAMAMLVKVLGYKPAITGEWPMNYISKAAELGLTKGMNLSPNTFAIRGDVADLTSNALTVPLMTQSTWGTLTSYAPDINTSLLETKLGCDEISAFITDTPLFDREGLDSNEFTFTDTDGDSYTYTFDSGLNMDALLLHDTTIWAKNNNVFYVADETPTSRIVTPSNSVRSYNGGADTITIKGTTTDVTYHTVATPVIFYNHELESTGAQLADSNVTLLMNKDNKVYGIIALEYSAPVVATKIVNTEDDQYIKVANATGATTDVTLTDLKYTVVDATGAIKSLSDIAKNDVVSVAWNIDTDQAWVRYVRTAVAGAVTKVTNTDDGDLGTFRVYVGTTAYKIATGAFTRTDGAYDAIDTSNADNLVGLTGTFYLNSAGAIFMAEMTEAATDTNYAFVDTTPWPVVTTADPDGTYYVKVLKMDGTKTTMELDSDYSAAAALNAAGKLFSYAVSDGVMTDVAAASMFTGAGVTINDDYDRIVSTATYVVTADTKVFSRPGNTGKATPITWGNVENATGTINVTIVANADYPNRADIVVLTGGTLTSAQSTAAMLKSYYTVSTSSGNVKHMIVDMDGTEKDYAINGATTTTFVPGELATLTLNEKNEVTGLSELTAEGTSATTPFEITSSAFDSAAGTLTYSSTVYFLTPDTIVYDYSGDDPVKVDASAVTVGCEVTLYADGSDNLTYVVITAK